MMTSGQRKILGLSVVEFLASVALPRWDTLVAGPTVSLSAGSNGT